ncbi:hypothetical protein Tco_1150634 [Tanacetum coccineum]
MGMYISSQSSCDFTTVAINGESEERRITEGIIRNYYDREDGETTPRFECLPLLYADPIIQLDSAKVEQADLESGDTQVDYECEMAFELLRLVKKQLKEGYGRIVGIKSLLEVTAVKLVLLVQKLLLLVLKVNVAGIKVTTAKRLQLLKG